MAEIRIPLASPAWEYHQLKKQIDDAVGKVLSNGKYVQGPEVGLLEQEAAQYLGTKHTVGCSSGTDALLMALMALGIGHDDEIVTTSFSFIATSSAIVRVGARPVFVDVEKDGFNLDANLLSNVITNKTRAIIVVHLFGQPADLDGILRVAREYHLAVIEDAAQAFGAKYRMHKVGTMGDFGCFSFFPAKPLGGVGDGGLVTASSDEADQLLRMIRLQGASGKNIHPIIGGNFRLDTLQAAIIRLKLQVLDGWITTRQRHAQIYFQKLRGLEGQITLPVEKENESCIWAQFSILAQRRDELRDYLIRNGIGCEVYYPMPLPYQDSMRAATGKQNVDFTRTERVCREILSIPIHPCVNQEQIEEVANIISKFYQ